MHLPFEALWTANIAPWSAVRVGFEPRVDVDDPEPVLQFEHPHWYVR
jgi:hypothetical protein